MEAAGCAYVCSGSGGSAALWRCVAARGALRRGAVWPARGRGGGGAVVAVDSYAFAAPFVPAVLLKRARKGY